MHQGEYMSVFVNGLFIFVSVMFFAGRMYEVLNLLETGTNFIIGKGIVTTPLMLCIAFLVAVCCGVLVYADNIRQPKNLKAPVSFFGFAPAPFIIGASVLNIIGIFKTGGFLGYDIMMILAAIGFAVLGVMNIKGKNREKLPVFLTMLMPIAMCINTAILKVQPIANTMFMYYGLSSLCMLVFFLLLFKNAYSPSAVSRPMLYVSALVNYLISGTASLANLIGGVMTDSLPMADILLDVALAIIGIYSLFIAFYIVPVGEKAEPQPKQHKEKRKAVQPVEEEEYVPDFLPRKGLTTYEDTSVFDSDADFRQANKISESTIAMLFAQKDEREHNAVIDTAVNEITTEIAVTQAIEKHNTRPVEVPQEATRVIRTEKINAPKTEKNVFRSTGSKKSTPTKTVYRAPKK